MWLTRISRKKKIDSSRICSSVYIISKKKRPVYMHIVISVLLYGSVLWLIYQALKTKMILPGGSWDIIFSHMGNERACALHPQE